MMSTVTDASRVEGPEEAHMNRKIDAENQAEDTEGHRVAKKRPALREDKPADTEGHKIATTRRPKLA